MAAVPTVRFARNLAAPPARSRYTPLVHPVEVRDTVLRRLRRAAREKVLGIDVAEPERLGASCRRWLQDDSLESLREEQWLLGLCVLTVLEGQDRLPGSNL